MQSIRQYSVVTDILLFCAIRSESRFPSQTSISIFVHFFWHRRSRNIFHDPKIVSAYDVTYVHVFSQPPLTTPQLPDEIQRPNAQAPLATEDEQESDGAFSIPVHHDTTRTSEWEEPLDDPDQPPRLWPGDRHPCSTIPGDCTTPTHTPSTFSARTVPAIDDIGIDREFDNQDATEDEAGGWSGRLRPRDGQTYYGSDCEEHGYDSVPDLTQPPPSYEGDGRILYMNTNGLQSDGRPPAGQSTMAGQPTSSWTRTELHHLPPRVDSYHRPPPATSNLPDTMKVFPQPLPWPSRQGPSNQIPWAQRGRQATTAGDKDTRGDWITTFTTVSFPVMPN